MDANADTNADTDMNTNADTNTDTDRAILNISGHLTASVRSLLVQKGVYCPVKSVKLSCLTKFSVKVSSVKLIAVFKAELSGVKLSV